MDRFTEEELAIAKSVDLVDVAAALGYTPKRIGRYHGILIPRSLRWKDGTVYEIQRVNDMRRAASLKAGGVGMRYTCMIDGRESHLYYEDNNLWFVEGRA